MAEKLDKDLIFATDSGLAGAFQPLNISSVSVSGGIVTVTFSAGTPSFYFSNGSKLYLTNFKSGVVGTYIDIDGLNGAQVVASVDDAAKTITFVARDYSSSNSQGITGAISS